MNDNIEKRKPGRPRKRPFKEPQSRKGIIQPPKESLNIVELIYDTPSNFKKICSYWKALNAEKITFIFDTYNLRLYTSNYKETNDVSITFNGNKMNSYYCERRIEITILFSNLELVLSKLDKTYETITFLISKKKDNTMHIIIKNDINIYEYTDIDIILDSKPTKVYESIFESSDYMIEFKLTGKYFKKMISDIKGFDKQWTIEKYGEDGNFIFKYHSSTNQVRTRLVPFKAEDLELKSTVVKKDIFSVTVFIDNIKPTSSNILSEHLTIRASKDKPLWISANIDKQSIIVICLIKIVDYKNLE